MLASAAVPRGTLVSLEAARHVRRRAPVFYGMQRKQHLNHQQSAGSTQ